MRRIITFFFLLAFSASLSAQLNMELRSQYQYNQRVSDVWGWTDPDDSTEYAVVGVRNGISIVTLADIENPEEVAFIPGPNSIWRDIKTWGHHIYVINETSNGVAVIDMTGAPDNITSFDWTPNIPDLGGTLSSCHNLYIDEFGYCYLTGCNLNSGGAIYVDVHSNPGQPDVVGWGPATYSHDIFARDNRMYTSEIYRGQFGIYDVSDKSNTVKLAGQNTPFNFTHNVWLNDESDVIFTTDERGNAPVAAYDISDLDNIQLLDEFRPVATLNRNVIPHNVHVWNNWLLISYYTDGGIVVDASRPDNLIEVGNFDSFLGNDGGFSGAWGMYPFFPSQTVLVSDINNGLFVLTPNYVRACWLEGKVTEKGTGVPLQNVSVEIQSSQANLGNTDFNGDYKTGQALPGTFNVTFALSGYRSKTVSVDLENGVLTSLNVELEKLVPSSIFGQVVDATSGAPVPNASILIEDDIYSWTVIADADGNFVYNDGFEGAYQIIAGTWGYQYGVENILVDGSNTPFIIELEKGYQDHFVFDYSWNTENLFGANGGFWERGIPNGTMHMNETANPGADAANDIGNTCYVTGNTGSQAFDDDVDNGLVRLTCPAMDLSELNSPLLNFEWWMFNDDTNGAIGDDTLSVFIVVNGNPTLLKSINKRESIWTAETIVLPVDLIADNPVHIRFEASDFGDGSLMEAGVDFFSIEEGDNDGDGFLASEDCDDMNADINPDATEIPNNDIDEDCDGVVLIIDEDGDGFNSDEDCDDMNADINPDATEIPNNDIDEDCDGVVLIIDEDGDGFNSDEDCDDMNADINPDATEIPNNDIDEDCDGVVLIIDEDGDGFNSDEDCDDMNADINPDATEIPNNDIDEDCDGVVLIIDEDGDGFNSDEDCDDMNADINPDATEIPNNDIDEDCDGVVLIIDEDGDGFNSDEDCDDMNPDINPDATEIPNNDIDEDCDGVVLIIDEDGDGFNSDEDCDDMNADINPDATEIPNNDIDEDCDGVVLIIDEDGDGFNSDEDCDDMNADINPDATEIPNNDIDEDCDGVVLIIDEDGDGFNSDEDCDDMNPDINPDAEEIPNNGIDEDCDGMDLIVSTNQPLALYGGNIYPNPFSDILYIETGSLEIEKLEIINGLGQMVYVQMEPGKAIKLNLNHLDNGLYFLSLIDVNGKDLYTKLIIKH